MFGVWGSHPLESATPWHGARKERSFADARLGRTRAEERERLVWASRVWSRQLAELGRAFGRSDSDSYSLLRFEKTQSRLRQPSTHNECGGCKNKDRDPKPVRRHIRDSGLRLKVRRSGAGDGPRDRSRDDHADDRSAG